MMNDTTLRQIAALKTMVNRGNQVWTWNDIQQPSWSDLRLSMIRMRKRLPCNARQAAERRPHLTHPNATLFGVLLCPPTAPGLLLQETETSVGRRFLGSSRANHCSPVSNYMGPWPQNTMARDKLSAEH